MPAKKENQNIVINQVRNNLSPLPNDQLEGQLYRNIEENSLIGNLTETELQQIFQQFFKLDGILNLFQIQSQNQNIFDYLYANKSHGISHIQESNGKDNGNAIPIVNSLSVGDQYPNGHPGLMSPKQARFLENLGFAEEDKNQPGETTTSKLDGIEAPKPNALLKLHSKVYIGASPNVGDANFSDDSVWDNADVEDRGLTVTGSTKVAQIVGTYLQVGSLTKFENNGDGTIGKDLTINGKLIVKGDQSHEGDIKTEKCFVTLDSRTGDVKDDGSGEVYPATEIIKICENRIINEDSSDFKDLYFYIGDKSYTTSPISNRKPTMILGYDATNTTGKVAINTKTAPTSSSPEFYVEGSATFGEEGTDASQLTFFGSTIKIQSLSGVSIKNLPLTGGASTSLDISSYGGLTLQGDTGMTTGKEVVVGSISNKVGIDLYGEMHFSQATTNQYPIAFYSNLPANSTQPTTGLLGIPFAVRYDGKFGIRTLPSTNTMTVMGGAEFRSETGSTTTYDNIVHISEIRNPGNPLDESYSTTSEYFGNNGKLVLKGTNTVSMYETQPPSTSKFYDIHLTGGKSKKWHSSEQEGIFHGVKIDGKVDIGTAGVDPKENLTLYNGSLILDSTNEGSFIDVYSTGSVRLHGGGNFMAFSGGLDISYDHASEKWKYGFSSTGIITAEEIHFGLVKNSTTGLDLDSTTRYGFHQDGVTRTGDLYVYGNFLPQNITNIDLGGGLLTSVHDIEGEKAPKPESEDAWSDAKKDGFFGEIKDYKSIKGSGEWGYLTGNNPDTGEPYHEAQSNANGASARPYDQWSNISNFHNIYGATPLLKEYGFSAVNPIFTQEDRLVGKLSGFKYLLAGDKSKSEDAGDNPSPYIRGFANIYGLFSDSVSENSIDIEWDATNAGDIKYFKNVVGFKTNPNKSNIDLLVEDPDNEGAMKKNPSYPDYDGGSLRYFQEIEGLGDKVHRGGIFNFAHIDLEYWDETLQRNITTAKFNKTNATIFKSLLVIGDPSSSTLDSYSGFIFKGGNSSGVQQDNVSMHWNSANKHFSFIYTDSETTPVTPSSPPSYDTDGSLIVDPNWADVRVGDLWVNGEQLTTPVSVINALNTNGVLFTDGTNKMLGDLDVNRNNIKNTTIAYVDEIRITPDSDPFHLDPLNDTDETALKIYSINGSIDADSLNTPRPLLIAPEDNSYVVLGEDNKGTSVIIGKSNASISKLIPGWDESASAELSLNYRNTSGTITEGLRVENDGDINIPVGNLSVAQDVIIPSAKKLTIGATETILDKDSLTVGTNTTLAGTGITVDSDFTIKTGGSSGDIRFKVVNTGGFVGVGDWSSDTPANALDVKGTFQASGVVLLGDPSDHQLKIEQSTLSTKEWMSVSTPDTDKRLFLDTTSDGYIHTRTKELTVGVSTPDTATSVSESGRFAWEDETYTSTGTEGSNNSSGEFFTIGVNPNLTNSPNSSFTNANSDITDTVFADKSKKFLRLFTDSSQWHNTHKHFKPTLVIGTPDEEWDSVTDDWKTQEVIPHSEYGTLSNPPTNWTLYTRYLDTVSSGSSIASQDDSLDSTKHTFFIQVPSDYTSADKIFKVGYYLTGLTVGSATDNTTRWYITKIKDLTVDGNTNDSNRKGFQIHTIPTDSTKVPDTGNLANTAWKYRPVVIPTVTVQGILKADNLGTSKLDATNMDVKKICWSPEDELSPKSCIYIAKDSTDSNKHKWFFDAESNSLLGDVVFTGKTANSVNYSFTAQEKLYGKDTQNHPSWQGNFGDYHNARNTVLKIRNLSDSDMGGKKPELVMSVSPSGVLHNDTDVPIKGIDFFELKTDQETIDTRTNPYDSGESLVQYGKNAIMSLYRHNRNSGTAQTLLTDYSIGNDLRQEYFRIDAREYYYEGSAVGGYDKTISSGEYDSFIRGTFDIKDHGVKPDSTQTEDPPLANQLLGLKLAGDLVESTAVELNYLANVSPGTTTLSKALVVGVDKELDYLKLTGDAYLPGVNDTSHGTYLGGTLITASATEINTLDGLLSNTTQLNYLNFVSTNWNPGILEASKAVVVNGDKYINEFYIGDSTINQSNSTSNNTEKHRLGLYETNTTVGGERKYEYFIRGTSNNSPTNLSNLTIESQQHLTLQTQVTNANFNTNGNIYIKPDNKLYVQATDSNYYFGTKKTKNYVSIGGDFASEETDISFSSSTPTTVLYTDVDPTISGVSTTVESNKKKIVIGFLTTSTVTPDDNDYLEVSVGSTNVKLRFDSIQSISTGTQATIPDIAGYNDTNRDWYEVTLTADAPDSVSGVYGQAVSLTPVINNEFGVIPADDKDDYETHKSNNASDPYTSNSDLYRSTSNVALNKINFNSSSPIDYATKFASLIADSRFTSTMRNQILAGYSYLIGIRSYWQNHSGTKYDGSTTEPSGSYSTGNSTTIVKVDDYLWAGKPSGIHDWHRVGTNDFLGTHTVDGQSYDWYYVDIKTSPYSSSEVCSLTGYFGQLGNTIEHRSGLGFTYVQVTETGTFLENPDQALTLQGVMSMVGIDPVYVSPYASSETPHYYADPSSTEGYLQNPAPINNRGHLWYDKDTKSLQFSIKDDAVWNTSQPLFTPSVSGEFDQKRDITFTSTSSAEVAVDTEVIIEIVAGQEVSPNTYRWMKKEGSGSWGAWQTTRDISGTAYALISDTNGAVLSVSWAETTGYTTGSRWRVRKGNVTSRNLSSTFGWNSVTGTSDIYWRDGYVGIFENGKGTPDPVDALQLGHASGNLLLQYPSDLNAQANQDAPDLIIRQVASSNPNTITLGLSNDSGTSYRPRLEIDNDHFNIDALDGNNIFLQQSSLAGKLIIGGATDLGTKVSVNGDVTIQKNSTSSILNIENSNTTSGTELKLANDTNVLFDGTITNSYNGVSTIQPRNNADTHDSEPSYIGSEKIFNISDTSNSYLTLKRTPAFSDDNSANGSKGALGIGTDRPYKKLHVKDGSVLIENSEPVLSLGTPDLIYKSGTQDWGSDNYYAEIFHNKDARLNFSAGDSITKNGQTQPDWNHGGKLDIIYRRGYNKIEKPAFTDPDGGSNSGSDNFDIDDQNLLEFTTTTYDDTGSFPNTLEVLSTKTRLVLDGKTGNFGIGDTFESYPAKSSINPTYKLDVQGALRIGVNFNDKSNFSALTYSTVASETDGGYLNDYKYTYDTLSQDVGTTSDFFITKEVVQSVERFGGTPPNPDTRDYQHTIDQTETSNYPYAKNNTTDAKKFDYLATVQISGLGVTYFSGGNVGVGKYFEDTRNQVARKPSSKFHVKDFAFTEEVDNSVYDNTTTDGTVNDATKFVESNSVLLATFEDVEKNSYGSVTNLTQQTGKWDTTTTGGKIDFFTKKVTYDKENVLIQGGSTTDRDGFLLDATGTDTNLQLYLQKDGNVGIGQEFSFISNVSNVITKRNTFKRVSNAGTSNNLSGLELKYQNTSLPQVFFLDDNKVTINTHNPDSTASADQYYNYTATDDVDLEYVNTTTVKLTYSSVSSMGDYTAVTDSDTIKFTHSGTSQEETVTVATNGVSTSGAEVTLTVTGLPSGSESFTTLQVFRHDILGNVMAVLTVNGAISANNIDPSGTTIAQNDALSVKYGDVKHSALYRRKPDGSIHGKDLWLSSGKLDSDLHFATYHDTGNTSTDSVSIRMTIGDSKDVTGTANDYNSFIDMFEDVNIKTSKDFTILNGSTDKFKVVGSSGDTTIAGTLGVTGNVDVNSKFAVTASSGAVAHSGNLTINTDKYVVTASTGAVAHSGGLTINTDKFAVTDAGAVSYVGDLAINTNKFNVAGSSGNTAIAGTLDVAEATSLSKTLEVSGVSTLAIVDIAGGANSAIDNTAIGAGTPFTGKFTTLESTGLSTLNSAVVDTTLSVTGKTTLSVTEIQSDLAVQNRLTVGYPYSYLSDIEPPIPTVLDVRSTTKFANDVDHATDFELRPIVATFSKKDQNSDNSFVSDRGHTGSVRVLMTPQPYTMSQSTTQLYSDDNNVVLSESSDTRVTLTYKDTNGNASTAEMAQYVMPIVGDTISFTPSGGSAQSLTVDSVSISGAVVTIDHDSTFASFSDREEFSHTYQSGHPVTKSAVSSDRNIAEIELNAVASHLTHFQNTGLGDLLFKNFYQNTAGTGGHIQFITSKPNVKAGTDSQYSVAPSVVIGAGVTHGQMGIGRSPVSGEGGARGATLALKEKDDENRDGTPIKVPASIYFENIDASRRAYMEYEYGETPQSDGTTKKWDKLKTTFEHNPTNVPLVLSADGVEVGEDLIPFLYDHTGLQESQTNSTNSDVRDLYFSNLDEYSTASGDVDYIVAGAYLKIFKHDDLTSYIRKKITSVDTTTPTVGAIVTLDSAIPSNYEFQTIYPTTPSDFPNASQTVGDNDHHTIKIGNLGSVYSGTHTSTYTIEIGSNNPDLSTNQYRWRRTKSDSSSTDWQTRSYTPGTTQDLGAFGGGENATTHPDKDWYGVKVNITQDTEATAETFQFSTRLASKVEVYKDIDIGSTDNYYDDVYAKGFSMKKLDSAPSGTTDYGKLWVKDSDGYLYFTNSSGSSQQLSDLSNNFSSVNVDLVPDTTNLRNIGEEGTASSYSDRKTFKDIIYSGSIKRWNGTDGYTTIGETSVAPPTKHSIQVNANSNTYVIDDSEGYFTVVNSEFDDTIRESYLDVKFDYTPTDTMKDEDGDEITDPSTHFENDPEILELNTSLLVPMDFSSWIDDKVKFKVKVNNTSDTEIKVDVYDTAQTQVGSTQTLSIPSANTWTDVALTEFVPGAGSPEWTQGDVFSIHVIVRLKKTSASVQLSTLKFQYNTESYSTTNVPLPHINSTSTQTEIDQQLEVGGDILPDGHNTRNLGSSTLHWDNVYGGDLHLSNEGSQGNEVDGTTGNWTVQEGDEDLFIINRKTGKKFKFKLEEIE